MSRWLTTSVLLFFSPSCQGGVGSPHPASVENTDQETPTLDASPTVAHPSEESTDASSDSTLSPPDSDSPDAVPDPGPPLDLLHPGGLAVGYYAACIITPTLDVKCFPVPAGGCTAANVDRNCAPPGLKAVQIAQGHTHNCWILPPGSKQRIGCWTASWVAHAGDVAKDPTLDPVQIVVGDDHTCVLNKNGSVACTGQSQAKCTPPAGLRAKFLSASGVFTCAITPDDTVTCWGVRPPEQPPGLKALHIAVGNDGANHQSATDLMTMQRHACAVKLDHTVVCWGDNKHHEVDVPPGILAKQVSVGTSHSCALLLDGQVRCWGTVASPAGLRPKIITSSHYAACAIKQDDTAFCWAIGPNFGQGQVNGIKVLAPGP